MNMSDKDNVDRRVDRTLTSLWGALFALLHEETWNNINVSGICKRANVARSSFYLHFQNKQELLDFGFEIGIKAARARILESTYDENMYLSMTMLTNHFYEGRKFLSTNVRENEYIFARFQKAVFTLFEEELKHRNINYSHDSLLFVIGGVFSILMEWTKNGYLESPELMTEKLNQIVKKLI